MLNVKECIYDILKNCGLPLEDTPIFNRKSYPYGLLRVINQSDKYYKNYIERSWIIKIDIFSTYAGDKECLFWRDNIVSATFLELMKNQNITYVENGFTIIDDKEQGPVQKHGIITLKVITTEEE